MRSNGLSQNIPIKLALAISSQRSAPSLVGLACSKMAQKLEPVVEAPDTAWQHTQGLSALLQAAKERPQRDPWEGEDLDSAPETGLGKLLAEARRARAAQHQGG